MEQALFKYVFERESFHLTGLEMETIRNQYNCKPSCLLIVI